VTNERNKLFRKGTGHVRSTTAAIASTPDVREAAPEYCQQGLRGPRETTNFRRTLSFSTDGAYQQQIAAQIYPNECSRHAPEPTVDIPGAHPRTQEAFQEHPEVQTALQDHPQGPTSSLQCAVGLSCLFVLAKDRGKSQANHRQITGKPQANPQANLRGQGGRVFCAYELMKI